MMRFVTILFFLFHAVCALAQTEEGLRTLNGTELYVKTVGTGSTIVIVHGGPGMNHTYFIPHLNALSQHHQVVYYDQRASGKSSISEAISLEAFVADLEALRESLGKEKIYLLAHSWGAIPAVSYAIAHPDRIEGIIFCNAVPLSKEYDGAMRQTQTDRTTGADSTDRSILIGSPNFKAGKSSAYKKLLLLSFRHSFYKEANFNKLDFDLPDNYPDASKALYTGLGKELSAYDYYESLRSFSFPVLVLHGQVDAIPLSASQRLADQVPNATLEVFKKSGHFIFIEENTKFTSIVKRFINK